MEPLLQQSQIDEIFKNTIYNLRSRNNIEEIFICMQLADNIHDFSKGRANLKYNSIENAIQMDKFLIKNSPSTIEESTPKQLSINTGLYFKEKKKKNRHIPIDYTNIDDRKLISDLIYREEDVSYIQLNEDNSQLSIDTYIEFIATITDLDLTIPFKRNLDGKKIFTSEQINMCKNIIYNFFQNDEDLFKYILDASNISLRKIFYRSTTHQSITTLHITEETNKWDMASNILPELSLKSTPGIASIDINEIDIKDLIMMPDNIFEIVIDDSYLINIDNISIFNLSIIKKGGIQSLNFKKLLTENNNYFYEILFDVDYQLLLNNDFVGLINPNNIKEVPILSVDLLCYPIGFIDDGNNKYYGSMLFKRREGNRAIIVVSRAYRKLDIDILGVDYLSDEIEKILEQNRGEESIEIIINHLYPELLERSKTEIQINKKKKL